MLHTGYNSPEIAKLAVKKEQLIVLHSLTATK